MSKLIDAVNALANKLMCCFCVIYYYYTQLKLKYLYKIEQKPHKTHKPKMLPIKYKPQPSQLLVPNKGKAN